jgi:hypothetical protein
MAETARQLLWVPFTRQGPTNRSQIKSPLAMWRYNGNLGWKSAAQESADYQRGGTAAKVNLTGKKWSLVSLWIMRSAKIAI